MEQKEEPEQEPEQTRPKKAERPRFKIKQISSNLADYSFDDYDEILLKVDIYTGKDDEETMELNIEQWMTLAEELPEVIKRFQEGA